jgi:hypothetical protein
MEIGRKMDYLWSTDFSREKPKFSKNRSFFVETLRDCNCLDHFCLILIAFDLAFSSHFEM